MSSVFVLQPNNCKSESDPIENIILYQYPLIDQADQNTVEKNAFFLGSVSSLMQWTSEFSSSSDIEQESNTELEDREVLEMFEMGEFCVFITELSRSVHENKQKDDDDNDYEDDVIYLLLKLRKESGIEVVVECYYEHFKRMEINWNKCDSYKDLLSAISKSLIENCHCFVPWHYLHILDNVPFLMISQLCLELSDTIALEGCCCFIRQTNINSLTCLYSDIEIMDLHFIHSISSYLFNEDSVQEGVTIGKNQILSFANHNSTVFFVILLQSNQKELFSNRKDLTNAIETCLDSIQLRNTAISMETDRNVNPKWEIRETKYYGASIGNNHLRTSSSKAPTNEHSVSMHGKNFKESISCFNRHLLIERNDDQE